MPILNIKILVLVIFLVIGGCDDTPRTININETENKTPLRTKVIRVPGNASTIQAGLNMANSFDTVLVKEGTYTGPGNHDLDFKGNNIILKSEKGPSKTIIDCNSNLNSQHRGFYFSSGESNKAIVEGFTVKGGFIGNGGAVYCHTSSPTFKKCIFERNHATASGGAVWCKSSQAQFINCTIALNSSMAGSGIFVSADATPLFENCIIAFNETSKAIFVRTDDKPDIYCTNIFGNSNGDWTESIAGQLTANSNFNINPLFCDTANGDLNLQNSSPCLAENNRCNALIGAENINCQ